MLAAMEAGEVFALLEGGAADARGAAAALSGVLVATREPWAARALLHYHARTGSLRALELLARAPDPHPRHLLDALEQQMRAERPARHHALAALAPLVARRPAWLHLVPAHAASRELLRAARSERDALPLLHALLALAALVPAAPALAAAHAPDLAEAVARALALEASGGTRAHLTLAARALFRALYATVPGAAVESLRAAGAELGGGARAVWERGAAALAGGVRLHPALLTGARDAGRWARAEPHDVLAEARRLSLPPPPRDEPAPEPVPPDAPPAPPRQSPAPPPGSTAQGARSAGGLRPGGEGWFGLAERSGAESAPHTPLPADDAAEPEPAVEATPENTPARDARAAFRFPGEGGAARALGRRSPGRHTPDALTARLARVAHERRAPDSPVPFGGAPPAAAARPEPRAAPPPEPEDREVRELTARAPPPDWPEAEPPTAPPRDPRALVPRRAAARAPPPLRARSVGPPGTLRSDAAVQTLDAWPEPYEFIVADFDRAINEDLEDRPASPESSSPSTRLDKYLSELYAGTGGARAAAAGAGELAEQLALAHAQLMYERWRREAHAERNRRLLGRCRQVRALELANAALTERVRALTRERDSLRAPPPPAPPAEPPLDVPRLLADERAARLRAEAALREAEAQHAVDAAELQRARGDGAEAARHVEALARAALAAERRAEHVRRLRRELLALSEREARLAAALKPAGGVAPDGGVERALRAAWERATADAEAAGARAEAAAARAHELEAALAARDAAVAELKRGARAQAEEAAARARALQDKYEALLRVLRARDERALRRLAAE